jgi:hypothetical protein
MRILIAAILLPLALVAFRVGATDPPQQATPATDPKPDPAARLDREFRDTVLPFVKNYCTGCHGKDKPKADVDLAAFTSVESIAKNYRQWVAVRDQLKDGVMPPETAKKQPTAAERRAVVAWIDSLLQYEAKRLAGDPGPVPPRRLSNAEYDYTIRDLAGVDIRPTREFPVDPANEAGFDNSAESLAMSPALLKKYLEAARLVSDHLVLMPDGIAFAPHAAVTDTDRDKFCVNRIIDFYKRQRLDYAHYFLAAWRFEHRAAVGKPNATLAEFAADAGLSAKYLATIHATLTEVKDEVGPVAALHAMWKELPAPDAKRPDAARAGCESMRDFVVKLRAKLVPEVKNLTATSMHNGTQSFVLWKNRQLAANRMKYSGGALQIKDAGLPPDSAAARAMAVPSDKDAAAKYEATFNRFCATFPDAFVVTERGRAYLNGEQEKKLGIGRLLSAGFHSMTGYFRDDGPLYDLILDEKGRKELDRLWRELDFATTAPIRQYTSFIWFERAETSFMLSAEFAFARAEDKDVTSEEKIKKLAEVYLAKAVSKGAGAVAQQAIKDHFNTISAQVRWVENARLAAESVHLKAVADLAERAYRRPLTKAERDGLAAFYKTLRDEDKLTHEEAIRDTLTSVLMSPHFCYRVDRAAPDAKPAGDRVPLSDSALASRLSYFLWSSMPDKELLDRAAAGELRKPEVLAAQARRMLRDPKARALATEFGGNWLDFRRFEEHNGVDRSRFPAFDSDLRAAMFEEPVRFFLDVARDERSVLDFLYAKHTFVNPVLARHYGMPEPSPPPRPARSSTAGMPDEWVRIDDADRYGRGGLLPMAVFMTKNAPGLRTSPVKRGYWVVRRLLGEHIPAPPAEVPELPKDESKLGELTLREVLAKHRDHRSCAGCHNKFDSVGVAFESFGPIGELRTKDLGGRPVETRATFPGGVEGAGLDGLKAYLRDRREEEFIDNLCRKMLAYALGRGLLLSDEELLREMRTKLKAGGHRFGVLVECIVTSPQFLNRRVE